MPNMFPMMGGLMVIVWFFLTIGIIIGYIFFLVAIWRLMKAHQSIAEALKEIKTNLKSYSSSTKTAL